MQERAYPNPLRDCPPAAQSSAVTIAKPISILNDNAGAATIAVGANSNPITVLAGPTVIKGLTLNGPGDGSAFTVGIQLVNGSGSLTVANCTITGFYDGVSIAPKSGAI